MVATKQDMYIGDIKLMLPPLYLSAAAIVVLILGVIAARRPDKGLDHWLPAQYLAPVLHRYTLLLRRPRRTFRSVRPRLELLQEMANAPDHPSQDAGDQQTKQERVVVDRDLHAGNQGSIRQPPKRKRPQFGQVTGTAACRALCWSAAVRDVPHAPHAPSRTSTTATPLRILRRPS